MSWQKAITEFKKAHDQNQNIQTNFKITQIPGQEKPIKQIKSVRGIICLKCGKCHHYPKVQTQIVTGICEDCHTKLIWDYELTKLAKLNYH